MQIVGNENILNTKKAIILNSSQSKTPCGYDAWVRSTAKAVEVLVSSGYAIVTSLGLNTWELVVHLTASCGGRQVIVNPEHPGGDFLSIFADTVAQFEIPGDNAVMIFPGGGKRASSPKAGWTARDKRATEMAECVVPVSIKNGGKLEKLIDELSGSKEIISDFRTDYGKPLAKPPQYDLDHFDIDPENWDFITHWTRTRHGPWPGQSRQSYYANIVSSAEEYPNNAFFTLGNIANELKIRGSSNRIRGGVNVIGFTGSDPLDALRSIRWLPKRTGWNFEPYGIAIRKNIAEKLGVRPVIYGNSDEYSDIPEIDRPFFQSKGGKGVDWSQENEWRHIGDLNLAEIDPGDIIFLVWRKSEALAFAENTKSEILNLGPE